jgi:hypothetical protein
MKMAVFWYVAPYSLLKIDRRFMGAYCICMTQVQCLGRIFQIVAWWWVVWSKHVAQHDKTVNRGQWYVKVTEHNMKELNNNVCYFILISSGGWHVLQKEAKILRHVKFRVFWDVAPCSHVEVDRRFRGAYCLHHRRRENLKFTFYDTCLQMLCIAVLRNRSWWFKHTA